MIDKDECCRIDCGHCIHFKVNADQANVESTCKRLDHKHLKFAKPWFKSYDCGQFCGCPCRDFAPKPLYKWLYEHWEGFDDFYRDEDLTKKTVSLVIDGDFSVRYHVKALDFINNTFLNEDGSLNWFEKIYYKQTRASFGYKLIHEKNPNYHEIKHEL